MKKTIVVGMMAATLMAFAEKPPFDFHTKPKDEAEAQARRAWIAERQLREYGGKIVRPGTQKGSVVIVNCGKVADAKLVDDRIDYFTKETGLNIVSQDGTFDLASPKVQGNLSLFIVDVKSLPPMLIAPESRWAMINLSPLKTDKAAFYEARIKKEITRGLALLLGAYNSQYPKSLLCGIASLSDLDNNPEFRLQGDIFRRFEPHVAAFGVTPARMATYRKACEEGWAPAPTNDAQKAIWNKVHALPTEPIKIKPETKKVTE